MQYSHLTNHFVTFQVDPSAVERVGVRDGHEIHIGAEYTFVELNNKLSLRGGVWFDPNHAIQYGSDGSASDLDARLKAVFPGGESLWHYCAGFGMPLSRSLEINAGSDFTSRRKYISASMVVRFGR